MIVRRRARRGETRLAFLITVQSALLARAVLFGCWRSFLKVARHEITIEGCSSYNALHRAGGILDNAIKQLVWLDICSLDFCLQSSSRKSTAALKKKITARGQRHLVYDSIYYSILPVLESAKAR